MSSFERFYISASELPFFPTILHTSPYHHLSLISRSKQPLELRIIIHFILHQPPRLLDLSTHPLIPHQLRHSLDIPLLPIHILEVFPPVIKSVDIKQHKWENLLRSLPHVNVEELRCIVARESFLQSRQRSAHVRTP